MQGLTHYQVIDSCLPPQCWARRRQSLAMDDASHLRWPQRAVGMASGIGMKDAILVLYIMLHDVLVLCVRPAMGPRLDTDSGMMGSFRCPAQNQ
jgi:hypothetical protein